MSSRRRGDARFDHGAQYFTARSGELARVIEDLAARGAVAPFEKERAPSGEARWVGTPSMRAVPQALSSGLDVRLEVRVTKLQWEAQAWRIDVEGGARLAASRLVVAIPAPQARDLLAASALPIPEPLARVEVAPCWALMAEVEAERAALPWTVRDAAPFSWICRQNDAETRTRWVAHADREFSERYLESSQDEIVERLAPPLLATIGATRVLGAVAHRWRFARTTRPAGVRAIAALDRRLVLAGDYCLGDRVEDAFTSGLAAAELISGLPGEQRTSGA